MAWVSTPDSLQDTKNKTDYIIILWRQRKKKQTRWILFGPARIPQKKVGKKDEKGGDKARRAPYKSTGAHQDDPPPDS
jgi:hypothetical protein